MLFPVPHQTIKILKYIGMLPYPSNMVLNFSQRQELEMALLQDAQSYLYNGVVSFGTAVHSIGIKNYGWAVVKLYYSVFYLARSKLAINQLALIYDQKTPFLFSLNAPSPLIKQTGRDAKSTHKLVLKLLKESFPQNNLFNYHIGTKNQPTLDWLMEQREIMNYTSAMMPDPDPPSILRQIIESSSINKWLETYENDLNYAIDEEHACLAYPFLSLLDILHEFKSKSYSCGPLKNHLNFIKNLSKRKNESLAVVMHLIHHCCSKG